LGVSNIGVSGQLANSTVQEIDPVQIDNGMVEVVPEPLSLTLIGVGTVGSTMVLRKRGRRG
ncbi:MAG: PEP-CTERM sorting domain-containing protein, partial [Candidatus Omnitrophica bacterium]|nr:PEP-CTERM sorting domain-containing protein [Candidatus Omnitrophota bacterium]